MKGGSQNFSECEMHTMEHHSGNRGIEVLRREPYYLTYLKQGKLNPKPKKREEQS